jgi:DEAD/DEAH box helicase domain-containing protein
MALVAGLDGGWGGAEAFADVVVDSPSLVFARTMPPRRPRYAELSRPLSAPVADRLARGGVTRLWAHQAEAIDLARQGTSVVVATGTASGKSLCFQVPIAEAVAPAGRSTSRDKSTGTALMLFPTKALAHDQLRALTTWDFLGVAAGAYDGDAGNEERAWIRRCANVVLTNPEMVHSGLLPHHNRWAEFLARLRYVVIDELHAFRGIFGSHVAHVVRRLRRLARHYGADPTFVCCSATIGEPARLASAVCSVDVTEVLDDGSPTEDKLVAIWNPRAAVPPGERARSSHHETSSVMAALLSSGHRTIAFCRSRRVTELVAAQVRRRLDRPERVRPYRGGFLAEERREVEQELQSGRLDGVVATTALELGVDIPGLDAVVLDGFPGTVASFWQQAGRAGRARSSSAALLVAGDDQLDQWFAAHPNELLTRPPEQAVINPANPSVADVHLRCAAQELPLTLDDDRYWSGDLDDAVRRLVLDDQLVVRQRPRGRGPQALYTGGGWPSHDVSLRAGSGAEVKIRRAADGDQVGSVELGRACEQVHPGAIYLHAGRTWRVVKLDLDDRVALVEPDDGATYTVARTAVDLRVLTTDAQRPVGDPAAGVVVGLGSVEVHQQVVGYQRKDVLTGEVLERRDLDLPASTLRTRAYWYRLELVTLDAAGVEPSAVPGALHAAEHAGIGVLPLFAICDRWDVGGVSTAHQAELEAAAIVIYDGYEGGAGVAELGYEAADRHLATTLDVIRSCRCTRGCPSCVQSPKCGNGNEPLDKGGAVALLSHVLGERDRRSLHPHPSKVD